jgi:hypothetical protein
MSRHFLDLELDIRLEELSGVTGFFSNLLEDIRQEADDSENTGILQKMHRIWHVVSKQLKLEYQKVFLLTTEICVTFTSVGGDPRPSSQ